MTDDDPIGRLERRARAVRARAAVRSWQYRQRHHAAGAWFRLRLALTRAREAVVLTDDEARQLVAEGYRPQPAGAELSPPKVVLEVDAARLRALPPRPRLPIALGLEFFAARAIALVPFDGTSSPP
jgi:hypothetical protein